MLLKSGDFEEEEEEDPLVEQLLENNDDFVDVLEPVISFFDTFHFSSIRNNIKGNVI